MGLWDDVTYVTILVASVGLGKLVRLIPPELKDGKREFKLRKWVSTILGLIIACLVSGWHVFHILVEILGNALVLQTLGSRSCHIGSMVWCFSYLMVFRMPTSVGLPLPPPHTNAIIMILTLKLVGLAFEVHDAAIDEKKNDKKSEESEVSEKAESSGMGDVIDKPEVDNKNFAQKSVHVPAFEDQIHYCLNHVGLIAGPYYRFSTWRGLYCDEWNPAVTGKSGVCEAAAWARITRVPLYVVAFLVSGYLFPLSVVETPAWQDEHGTLYKILYMAPIFFTFRMRIYSGFCLSEVVCIMSGLGAYPSVSRPRPGQGPTVTPVEYKEEDEVNFETVHNIDEWGTDFVPSMREALKCWNMTVQHWLVLVVYKRFPVKSLRTAAVMFVSSVWHGVHPGYYLGLCSVPLCLLVEDRWRTRVRARLSTRAQVWYDWVAWIIRMRWFDYLGMAFLLLRIDATLMYWSSVYYCGHLSLLVFLLLLHAVQPILNRVLPRVEQDHSRGDKKAN